MEQSYTFRRITPEEVPQMFALIRQRMQWMDAQDIQQWNVAHYDEIYPLSYYEDECRQGRLYVLARGGEVVCGAVLLEQDERWPDDAPAYYIHNLASKEGVPGAGAAFLRETAQLARAVGKQYLRLDSAERNEALARYYAAQGFQPAGTCQEGGYRGVLRQKALL